MLSYPNVEFNTNMYTDLVDEFIKNNNNVIVVAPSESINTEMCSEGNTKVLRVKTGKLFNVNPITKGISNIKLASQFTSAITRFLFDTKFDLIISPTPPITLFSTIKSIKKRDNCKSYLILRDIFPQNAKDLGLIKNSFLFNYFRKKEKQMYDISNCIGCMSQGNIDYVKDHNEEVESSKLHLLPNWIRVKGDANLESFSACKARFNLEGKFVAVYGGNLGKPQKAEFIIELAEELKYLKDVVFLIIGKGTEKRNLEIIIQEKNLSNVVMKDYLPREEYTELVRCCDIGLVNLSNRFTIPNIPSRTLAYFEANIPILAAVDKNTDYGDILDESESGLWSITGDIDAYKSNFLKLYENVTMRNAMGNNGFEYLKNELNVENAYKTIVSHV